MRQTVMLVAPVARLRLMALAVTCACGLALAQAASAQAGSSVGSSPGGGIRFTFDGELSQGATWRMSSRNNRLVGPSNRGGAATDLEDDGNLSSDRGDLVTAPTSLLATLEADAGAHRVLLRGSYVYDGAVMDKWRHWGADPNPEALRADVKDAVCRRARLLDAYYAGNFALGGGGLEFKLGRQALLWGEAKFLAGGINMFNSVEAWKTHKAGISLKEVILPVAAAAGTWQVNSHVTVQGFYQLERAKFEYDPVGTFFSDIDILGEGAGATTIVPAAPPLFRDADRKAKKDGQFGIAAFTRVGDWGLGFYYQNLHQRAAKVSGRGINGRTSYFWEYPEDVQTFGMSFNTGLGSAAVYGEVAYRKDVPVGLDAAAVGTARVNGALCGAILRAPASCGVNFAGPPFNIPIPPLFTTPLRAQADGYVRGWTPVDQVALNLGMSQAMTGSSVLPRVLRADGGALFLEANTIYSDLPASAQLPTQVRDKWHGSVFALMSLDYLRVAGSGISISPRLVLQAWLMGDDVSQAPFYKGRLAVSPGIQFRREQAPDIALDLSYTNLSDHASRGDRVLSDRDYLAVQLKWTF